MKVGVLFSGGKDSTYAAWLAKKEGHEIVCLITLYSLNKESYMFHTPAIEMTEKQAKLMEIPLVKQETLGVKEGELLDLKRAIRKAIKKHEIEGIVTGALASDYQASRILEICRFFKISCINPLWQKNQSELLKELVRNRFEVIISGVAAYPLDKKWIGRKIDEKFIADLRALSEKYKVNPAGEGGEFETLVVSCPLFKERLKFEILDIVGEGNSWRGIFRIK